MVRLRFSVWLVSGYAQVFYYFLLSLSLSLNPDNTTPHDIWMSSDITAPTTYRHNTRSGGGRSSNFTAI